MLRHYPTDSPRAAARIVAMTVLSDGRVSLSEHKVLKALDAPARLGLAPGEWQQVLQELRDDLRGAWALAPLDGATLDPALLLRLFNDVADPRLRLEVLELCVAVAEADTRVSLGEELMLVSAVEHWGLQAHMFERDPGATPPRPS